MKDTAKIKISLLFFNDVKMKLRPKVKKIKDGEFKVIGSVDGKTAQDSQITFFKNPVKSGTSVFGLLTDPKRK